MAHLHWHLIPRHADDPHPLRPTWEHRHEPRRLSDAESDAVIAAIRHHLA